MSDIAKVNNIDDLQKCIRCKERKILSEFTKREGHHGYRKVCKVCCDKKQEIQSKLNYTRKELINWNSDAIYC
ncbi:MAG: hypothetical protein ISS11_08035 [Candidatus Marinimicrobia bacterium]|nr:hypothetical protein [Candidatus Neomarinimicrobiota bacterium]